MIQRPQTLLFFGAAIIALIATFSPISTFSPSEEVPGNPKLIVKTSDVDFSMDKPNEIQLTDEEFEKGMIEANESLDKEFKDRGISSIFTAGFFGMILLAILLVVNGLMFKNRKFQIRFGTFLTITTILVTIGVYFASQLALEILTRLELIPADVPDNVMDVSYSYGFYLFPLIALLTLIGVILVKKDDKLIKSVDRIR